jgi:hypothetical protein
VLLLNACARQEAPVGKVPAVETGDTGAPAEERVVSLATADGVVVGDASESVGSAVALGPDVLGTGEESLVVGAYLASRVCVHDDSLTGQVLQSDAPWCVSGDTTEYLGYSLTIGEVTGDGQADLVLGALGDATVGSTNGAVVVFPGPLGEGTVASTDGIRLYGEAAGDYAGSTVTALGDVDGDGDGDLLVGAMSSDAGGSGSGRAYLVRGPYPEEGGALLDNSPTTITGYSVYLGGPPSPPHGVPATGDGLGSVAAAIGDVDGDGLADLALGVTGSDINGTDAGTTAVFVGPVADGDLLLTDADKLWYGDDDSPGFGDSVSGTGDIDGDGYADIASSADMSNLGTTWILAGPGEAQGYATDAAIAVDGILVGDNAGASLAGGADLDGDGTPDLLVGVPDDDQFDTDAGAACALYGPLAPGRRDLSTADRCWLGEAVFDVAGAAVATGEDGSVLVGAAYSDRGGQFSGAAFLIRER